jgi:hypothetical protein
MTEYILFHQFKHHLNYIKAWIDKNKGGINEEIMNTIKTLGSSQLDMYCGSLGVEEILQQISVYLQLGEGITTVELYKRWVGAGYKPCLLSDGSSFTLRYINHTKPIHIHPARHVLHTMRIKANSLKTAVCYLLVYDDSINVTYLNAIRKEYLGLPPIALKLGIEELERVLSMLCS